MAAFKIDHKLIFAEQNRWPALLRSSSCLAKRWYVVQALTPYNRRGNILYEPITDYARQIYCCNSILGVALNSVRRERLPLSLEERLNVVGQTAEGLKDDHFFRTVLGPSVMVSSMRSRHVDVLMRMRIIALNIC